LNAVLFLEMTAHKVCGSVPHLKLKTTVITFSQFFIIDNQFMRVKPNFAAASRG
jgi:hypothetical protein